MSTKGKRLKYTEFILLRIPKRSIKGKRLKYTEFILLRIPKGIVDMNSYWLERIETRVLLLDF